jgi:hypothetical protein
MEGFVNFYYERNLHLFSINGKAQLQEKRYGQAYLKKPRLNRAAQRIDASSRHEYRTELIAKSQVK